MKKMKKMKYSKFLPICVLLTLGSIKALAQVAISSVDVTESRCSSSGTAIGHATAGTSPYIYALTAGPITRADQTDSLFSALPPGTYTLRVKDMAATLTTSTFTIAGSYATHSFTPTFTSPICPGAATAQIIGHITGGRLPYSCELIAPSPTIRGLQASDTFNNVLPGTYTMRVYDSCSNFQTRTFTIPDASPYTLQAYVGSGFIPHTKVACDSFTINGVPWNFSGVPPIWVKQTTSYGDTSYDTLGTLGGSRSTFYTSNLHLIKGYNTSFNVNVVDGCGQTLNVTNHTAVDSITTHAAILSCNECYLIQDPNTSPPSSPPLNFIAPKYYLKNSLGVIIDSTTNANPKFCSFPPGNYTIHTVDSCGTTYDYAFTWNVPTPTVNVYKGPYSCQDSTAGVAFDFSSTWGATITSTVISGPAGWAAITNKGKWNVTAGTYTYPFVLPNVASGTVGVLQRNFITNLAVGTYRIAHIDSCGHTDTSTVIITPADVASYTDRAQFTKGCINANKIWRNHQSPVASNLFTYNNVYTSSGSLYGTLRETTDTLFNVPSGTYIVAFDKNSSGTLTGIADWNNSATLNGQCTYFNDTIVIPPYSFPLLDNVLMSRCGTDIHTVAIPNPNQGIPPYKYEITSGPGGYTAAIQYSPYFTVPTIGTYTYRISDSCGNSSTRSVSLDKLLMPPLNTQGSGCIGSVTKFYAYPNPFYTYIWTKPDGSTYTGDTLTLNPVVTTDLGVYTVTLISNVTGCTDTLIAKSGPFVDCSVLPVELLSFSGYSNGCIANINWTSGVESNMDHYELEKSSDARNYNSVAQQPIKGSNSAYSINIPNQVTAYYRLKMVNSNSSINYSQTIRVKANCTEVRDISLIPNPAKTDITILGVEQGEVVRICNLYGQTVAEEKILNVAQSINITTLPVGVYVVQVLDDNVVITTVKLIKH
jgi:hypothetical protein